MITEYFTGKEILEELRREEEEVVAYMVRNQKKIVRFFCHRTIFPVMVSLDYRSKEGNQYLIFLECKERRWRNDFGHILYHNVCIYNNGGVCAAILNTDFDEDDNRKDLDILSAQVFSRYRTRFLKDDNISNKELIRSFFMRNIGVVWREGIAEHHVEGSCQDGVLFGIQQENIFLIKTFVTFEMLFENQKELKGELLEDYLDMKFTIMDKEVQKEKVTTLDALEKYIEQLKRTVK